MYSLTTDEHLSLAIYLTNSFRLKIVYLPCCFEFHLVLKKKKKKESVSRKLIILNHTDMVFLANA